MENQKRLGASAFLPLIVFLALYVGCGITFTLMGVENPFGMFPRHVALLAGIAAALMLAPKVSVTEKLDVFCQSMGNSGVMMIVLIYLMAGGFQGAAASMGGKDSVINLALHFIPVTLLIPGVFLMCCFISTAIGTSMGTIAAMAPVAIGVATGAGLNPAIVGAAVIGGSYFGDNLSMISDTTISAAQGCGSEMKDKFRMNFFIALPTLHLVVESLEFVGCIVGHFGRSGFRYHRSRCLQCYPGPALHRGPGFRPDGHQRRPGPVHWHPDDRRHRHCPGFRRLL